MTSYTVEDTLRSLRDEIEADHSEGFGMVYLDNARLPGQTSRQFQSHLAVLSVRGDYRVVDGLTFGAVRRA